MVTGTCYVVARRRKANVLSDIVVAGSTCAISGMRSSAVASQDHQRGVIRRRRNEARTLRLRSSRATTRPR
jgi:hypothetical protein